MRPQSLSLTKILVVGLIATVATVSADPPKKPSLMTYSKLWISSPFTIKPEIKPAPPISPLERDWMLGSIRPGENGYSVTLINKKDRKDRIRLIPGFASSDWQLIKVEQDTKNNENSRVQIRKGSQTAWISYDEKLIKIRPAVASKASTKKPQTSSRGSARPPIPGRGSTSTNKPRVRSVPRKRGR